VPGTIRFGDYDRLRLQSPAVPRESPIYRITATGKIASAEERDFDIEQNE
jgi:hypothetical protein